jgi:Flp pilus assembly protein TadB
MNRLRLVAAVLGIALAAIGVGLDSRPLVWVACAVLGASVVLRLILRSRR